MVAITVGGRCLRDPFFVLFARNRLDLALWAYYVLSSILRRRAFDVPVAPLDKDGVPPAKYPPYIHTVSIPFGDFRGFMEALRGVSDNRIAPKLVMNRYVEKQLLRHSSRCLNGGALYRRSDILVVIESQLRKARV